MAATAPRILIVDDEPDARAGVRTTLEDRGYSVIVAQDGKRALHCLTSDEALPDLILLDLNMPEMNGWELVTILARYTALASIPTVIVSGLTNHIHSLQGLVSGVIKKPVESEALLKVVDQQLARAADKRQRTPAERL